METSENDPLLSNDTIGECRSDLAEDPPTSGRRLRLNNENEYATVSSVSGPEITLGTSAPDTPGFKLRDMASDHEAGCSGAVTVPDVRGDPDVVPNSGLETNEVTRARTARPNPFKRTDYGSVQSRSSLVNSTESAPLGSAGSSINLGTSCNEDGDSYQYREGSPGDHFGLDDITILQACVFLEDAIKYRSIHHRVDWQSLHMYRIYYSKPVEWLLFFVLFTIHILAFFEYPSSLTATSDLRYRGQSLELPCGITEAIEIVCLLVLATDLLCKSYLKGKTEFLKSKWLLASSIVLLISFVDWSISVGMMCSEVIRVRRILRPFFLLQNSSLMKKTVNCLRKTVPHVVSVLLLLFLHLYFFTLLGILLFPKQVQGHHKNSSIADNSSQIPGEGDLYFPGLMESFINLLVLLTTANNPDVMIPAYSTHRLYAIFFIVYLMIGLYCFMNMLTAVVYNQFRGYFSNSIQASLFRRRLGIKAMYEVLRRRQVALRFSSSFSTLSSGVPIHYLKQVISRANIPCKYLPSIDKELAELPGCLLDYRQFQEIFSVLDTDISKKTRPEIPEKSTRYGQCLQRVVVHRYFSYVGCLVAAINMLCITLELGLEYDHIKSSRNTYLGMLNLLFVLYFCVEQSLKIWAMGWQHYTWVTGNIIDGLITVMLLLAQGIYLAFYGIPFLGKDIVSNRGLTLWDLVRIINILIMVRLLRMIISLIKAMSIVCGTLFDLVKNLRAFAGILVVIYYSYALLGMELFRGKIKYDSTTTDNITVQCGTYRQLQYWANNFDDFAMKTLQPVPYHGGRGWSYHEWPHNEYFVKVQSNRTSAVGTTVTISRLLMARLFVSRIYVVNYCKAALVVLWDIMVVNNWHVFLEAYKHSATGWSQIYFIVWWLLSVVITLNLFTALILENFIMRWDRQLHAQSSRSGNIQDSNSAVDEGVLISHFTVHDMFRSDLQEPSDEALTVELHHHPHFEVC